MADNISEIKAEVKEINNKFDIMLEKLESKFAAKWTETAIKWFIVLVMTIVLSAIIYEVVKK